MNSTSTSTSSTFLFKSFKISCRGPARPQAPSGQPGASPYRSQVARNLGASLEFLGSRLRTACSETRPTARTEGTPPRPTEGRNEGEGTTPPEPLKGLAEFIPALVTAWRERGGNRVISKRDAVAAILQALRRCGTVGILIDQHISEQEGAVVPFFDRPASTATAPALIALRSGAPVLPVGIMREVGRGRYRIRVGEEVPVRRSGDLRTYLVVNTARITQTIEAMVRDRPDHWFWVHRRWKTMQALDPRLEAAGEADAEGDRTRTTV